MLTELICDLMPKLLLLMWTLSSAEQPAAMDAVKPKQLFHFFLGRVSNVRSFRLTEPAKWGLPSTQTYRKVSGSRTCVDLGLIMVLGLFRLPPAAPLLLSCWLPSVGVPGRDWTLLPLGR